MSHQGGRLAFTALVATLLSLDAYVAVALARQQPVPWAAVAPYATLAVAGLLAAPLVWWRQRAGYVGATAFGLLNVIANLLASAGGVWRVGALPQPTMPLIASTVTISALVVLYGVRAWREQAAPLNRGG